jgi:hypothetical protein
LKNNLTTTSSACAGCGSRALGAVGSAFAVVSTRAFTYSFTSLSIIQSIFISQKETKEQTIQKRNRQNGCVVTLATIFSHVDSVG